MAFGRVFGELAPTISGKYQADNVKEFDPALKHISVISNVVENGVAIGALGDGEALWHSDFSFHEVPYSATLLYSLEIPPLADVGRKTRARPDKKVKRRKAFGE